MTATRWPVGAEPLTIFNGKCGLGDKFAKAFLNRATLIYVDLTVLAGNVDHDADGYLPHLRYTPHYAQTEGDEGVNVLTGNLPANPVWRFDPGPFFSDCTGKVELVGGSGDAVFQVGVYIRRYSKILPLRHTLTVSTRFARFRRPLGCSGLWLPDGNKAAQLSVGGYTQTIQQPNGGFVAMGPFEEVTFVPSSSVVSFEIVLPL